MDGVHVDWITSICVGELRVQEDKMETSNSVSCKDRYANTKNRRTTTVVYSQSCYQHPINEIMKRRQFMSHGGGGIVVLVVVIALLTKYPSMNPC